MSSLVDLLTAPFGTHVPGDNAWALLPLRLALGIVLTDSGLGKWRRGIDRTSRWFQGLGIPFAYVVARAIASLELIGGVLLVIGLAVHWVAIPLAVSMTVATYVQKFKLNAPFQGGDVQGYELDVLMVAGLLLFILGGAGAMSADWALGG